jgi:hypothetical protein
MVGATHYFVILLFILCTDVAATVKRYVDQKTACAGNSENELDSEVTVLNLKNPRRSDPNRLSRTKFVYECPVCLRIEPQVSRKYKFSPIEAKERPELLYLPNCEHIICENCAMSCFKDLETDSCPMCRRPLHLSITEVQHRVNEWLSLLKEHIVSHPVFQFISLKVVILLVLAPMIVGSVPVCLDLCEFLINGELIKSIDLPPELSKAYSLVDLDFERSCKYSSKILGRIMLLILLFDAINLFKHLSSIRYSTTYAVKLHIYNSNACTYCLLFATTVQATYCIWIYYLNVTRFQNWIQSPLFLLYLIVYKMLKYLCLKSNWLIIVLWIFTYVWTFCIREESLANLCASYIDIKAHKILFFVCSVRIWLILVE